MQAGSGGKSLASRSLTAPAPAAVAPAAAKAAAAAPAAAVTPAAAPAAAAARAGRAGVQVDLEPAAGALLAVHLRSSSLQRTAGSARGAGVTGHGQQALPEAPQSVHTAAKTPQSSPPC